MKVILCGENEKGLWQWTEYLECWNRTELRRVQTMLCSVHVDFCRAVRDGTGSPRDGTEKS